MTQQPQVPPHLFPASIDRDVGNGRERRDVPRRRAARMRSSRVCAYQILHEFVAGHLPHPHRKSEDRQTYFEMTSPAKLTILRFDLLRRKPNVPRYRPGPAVFGLRTWRETWTPLYARAMASGVPPSRSSWAHHWVHHRLWQVRVIEMSAGAQDRYRRHMVLHSSRDLFPCRAIDAIKQGTIRRFAFGYLHSKSRSCPDIFAKMYPTIRPL